MRKEETNLQSSYQLDRVDSLIANFPPTYSTTMHSTVGWFTKTEMYVLASRPIYPGRKSCKFSTNAINHSVIAIEGPSTTTLVYCIFLRR